MVRPKTRLRLIVKGEPGAGKSSSTRYTAAECARESAERLRRGKALPDQVTVPFWVTAGDLAERKEPSTSTELTLLGAMAKQPGLGPFTGLLQPILTGTLEYNHALIIMNTLNKLTNLKNNTLKIFNEHLTNINQ